MAVIFATVLVFPVCNLISGLPQWGLPLLYGALAAVAEECFFRAFLFVALEKRGRYLSAILTSLVFALLHLWNLANYPLNYTLLQVTSAFCVGFALCGLLWKAKKLWPCITCHLLINLTGGTALSPLSITLTVVCMFLYALFGILLFRKKNEVLL